MPAYISHIEDKTFQGRFELEEIFFIPDSVLTIGEMAFESCIRLRKVKLSNNIVSISAGVFANCIENEKLVIPDIVRKFERGCFKGSGIQK